MKHTATRLVRITVLMSACACVTYVAHVVRQEVAYVQAKVNKLASAETPRQVLRWPESVALPELGVSAPKTGVTIGTDD